MGTRLPRSAGRTEFRRLRASQSQLGAALPDEASQGVAGVDTEGAVDPVEVPVEGGLAEGHPGGELDVGPSRPPTATMTTSSLGSNLM